MTFDEWWEDFVAEHNEWKYADSAALRRAAFQAGAASRDAEVVSLTNQRDYEYVRAENAASRDAEIGMLITYLEYISSGELGPKICAALAKDALAKMRKP